jgi:hypothetical protein
VTAVHFKRTLRRAVSASNLRKIFAHAAGQRRAHNPHQHSCLGGNDANEMDNLLTFKQLSPTSQQHLTLEFTPHVTSN